METYQIEKTASGVIDHQDDPGHWWNEQIQPHWPDDVDEPTIGVRKEASDCIAKLNDGEHTKHRFPTKEASDALASTMYFLAFGKDALDKEACKDIAQGLTTSLQLHDLEVPRSFIEDDFDKEASQEDVYADDGEHLPVTTPDQCEESVDVFQKNASNFGDIERVAIGQKLKEAAQFHELDIEPDDIPYGDVSLQKDAAVRRLGDRIDVMKGVDDHPGQAEYIAQVNSLKRKIESCEPGDKDFNDYNGTQLNDYREVLKCASELSELDKEANMDIGWNKKYPDPVDTLFKPEPEHFVNKEASSDKEAWREVDDWDGLRNHFDDEVVDEIEKNAEKVIPTLPRPHKDIVEQYARGELDE